MMPMNLFQSADGQMGRWADGEARLVGLFGETLEQKNDADDRELKAEVQQQDTKMASATVQAAPEKDDQKEVKEKDSKDAKESKESHTEDQETAESLAELVQKKTEQMQTSFDMKLNQEKKSAEQVATDVRHANEAAAADVEKSDVAAKLALDVLPGGVLLDTDEQTKTTKIGPEMTVQAAASTTTTEGAPGAGQTGQKAAPEVPPQAEKKTKADAVAPLSGETQTGAVETAAVEEPQQKAASTEFPEAARGQRG